MDKIAVVGIGTLFSHSRSPAEFWRNICQGRDLIEDVPKDHWLPEDFLDPIENQQATTYCKRGSFIPMVSFNPLEYGIPPDRIASITPAQLLSLLVTKQVLEDVSDFDIPSLNLERTGIILGASSVQEISSNLIELVERPHLNYILSKAKLTPGQFQYITDAYEKTHVKLNESTFPGLLSNVISGRVANRFNLTGTNCSIDAACASSLAAVDMAIDKLLSHQADMMLAGGADTSNDALTFVLFSKTPALSPTGNCRPFSEYGDGIVLGEGVAIVALKRLEDAIRDNNKIYALITGSGSSSDGRVKSIYSPYAEGQLKALKRCYESAGIEPKEIELIEAHGTSTKAGDKEEITALKMLFGDDLPKRSVALGSIKSQLGHTKAAAGVAGLIKVILSLHHKVIPPSIKVEKLHPLLQENNHPFYVTEKVKHWPYKGKPRRGSVSAFGFGGINYHITAESYEDYKSPYFEGTRKEALLVFSAESKEALVDKLQKFIAKHREGDKTLDAIEYESWSGDHKNNHKIAIIVADDSVLMPQLNAACEVIQNAKQSDTIKYQVKKPIGKVVYLFPGHGGQYKGMGTDLIMNFQKIRNNYDQVSNSVINNDYTIQDVIFDQNLPKDILTNTKYAQPAIVTTSMLYHDWISSLDIEPDVCIGHSLGELTALYAAKALDRDTLIELSKERGQLMGSTLGTDCGMLVVFENPTVVLALIEDWGLKLELTNFNSVKQVVVSGLASEIEKLIKLLMDQNINHVKLATNNAYHMSGYNHLYKKFRKILKSKGIYSLDKAVFSNINGLPYENKRDNIIEYLCLQLKTSVKFMQSIQNAYMDGARTFIEMGPGSILSGFVKNTIQNKNINIISLDNQNIKSQYLYALAELYVCGLADNIEKLSLYKYNSVCTPYEENGKYISINGSCYNKGYPRVKNEDALEEFDGMSSKKTTSNVSNGDVVDKLVEAHLVYQQNLLNAHKAFLNTISQISGQNVNLEAINNDIATQANISQTTVPLSNVVNLGANQGVTQPMQTTSVSQPISNPGALHQSTKPQPVPPVQNQQVVPPVQNQQTVPPVQNPQVNNTINSASGVTQPAQAPQSQESPPVSTSDTPNTPEQAKSDLYKIISESIGYDESMLSLEMDLESDLGIDSLRRVELLSQIGKIYTIPEDADTNQLTNLKTLGDIVNLMNGLKKK